MIPLVSSICYGPARICQVPRLWWKALLQACGQLDAEYPECSGGLDRQVLELLGLDRSEVLEHIHGHKPDYLSFEAWVLGRRGGDLDEEARQTWNAGIRGRVHNQHKIDDIYATLGFADDAGVTSAVVLNHLEDWHFHYEQELAGDDLAGREGAVVPLISTLDYGALGLCQVPRTWHKVVLEARGLLHEEYPGCGGGLDLRVLRDVLGLDRDQVVEYLTREQPSYLAFEAWIRQQLGGEPEAGAVREWNAYVNGREHNEDKQRDIAGTLGLAPKDCPTSAVILNHIEDWHLAHAACVAKDGP